MKKRLKVSKRVYGVIHHENYKVFLAGVSPDKKHLAKKFVEEHEEGHSLGVFCCSSDNGFISTNFLHCGEKFEETPEHKKTIHGIFKGFLLGHQPSPDSIKVSRIISVGDEVGVLS